MADETNNNSIWFDVYHNEIFQFLRTATIKFSPFSILFPEQLKILYPYYNFDEEKNYYYERLLGNYVPGDEEMWVTSVDTGADILFSKEALRANPKTALVYKIHNQEYQLLCKRYPNQVDLIKSIVYPVADISVLENANDFALVAGDTSILQENEVKSITDAINHFCTVCRERWWVKEYCFEEGYPIAFYSLMWQLLPLVCFTTRMTNVRTSSVHQFHIWEYLCSKGLEDYRDILTLKQSLFLYRNMEYILANKGTMENMIIIADNILSEFSIALLGKYLYQQQVDRYDECRRTPEVISKKIVSYLKQGVPDTTSFETIEVINGRMYTKGIEVNDTPEWVAYIEKIYGECEEDRLPTKLLELRKEPVASNYEAFLIEFIFDTLIYRWGQGKLPYTFKVLDPISNITMTLTVGEGLALIYYLTERSLYSNPINIPTTSFLRVPYLLYRPFKESLPSLINIEHNDYKISAFVNVDNLLNDVPWIDDEIIAPEKFVDLIYDQFSIMVRHIKEVRGSADLCYTRSMWTLYHHLCYHGNYPVTLTPYKTYRELIRSSPTIKTVFDSYTKDTNPEDFTNLATAIFSAMVPINDQRFKPYVGYLESLTELFKKLTSLCIQLFSHNVTFLGSDRDKQNYLYIMPLAYHHLDNWGVSYALMVTLDSLRYDGVDNTIVYDTLANLLSYHGQYDSTNISWEELPSILSSTNLSIQEFGISHDKTRTHTSIQYTFE